MIPLQEICCYLDDLLQSGLFEDYGPNGLQVQGVAQVSRVATAVSASLETIQEAVKRNVQLLIVHHGLFWNKDSYVITGTKKEKIEALIKNGISLVAYHLPLDAHQEIGNNWKAARDMGWQQLEPFGKVGVQGVVKGMKDVAAFQKTLEDYYGHPAYYALGNKQKIEKVALVSGGAHWQIKEAAALGLDSFITGSFDEPIWHIAHEEKVNFFAMGHSATERVGPKALAEHLEKAFPLSVSFIDKENPF